MYEWLEDFQTLSQQIDYLDYKLEREQIELNRHIEGDLGGRIMHPESISSELEERIELLEKEILFKKGQMKKLMNLINTFSGLENNIIKLKYIDGMKLEEIAEELSYSESHIKKKHAELVRCIKFVEKYNFDEMEV